METASKLIFYVNGKKVVDDNVDPEYTLIQYLRKKLILCGTKLGCAEGGCGACTVMVSRYNRIDDVIEHISVNACLYPIGAVHGTAVTTVEGIGSTRTTLHPVQERIAKAHGSQCGFCTPGFVMSMYTLLRNNSLPTVDNIQNSFQGNLCRCTGYRPILEGLKTLAKDGGCCGGAVNGQCCKQVNGANGVNGVNGVNGNCDDDDVTSTFSTSNFAPYDPSQEPIFPPELKLSTELDEQHLIFKSPSLQWIRPNSMKKLLDLKSEYPNAKLVVGNTEVGIEVKFKNSNYPVIIAPTAIPELKAIKYDDDGISFGGSVTITTLGKALRQAIVNSPEPKTRIFVAIVEMLELFAGNQIRNVAAIAGNIMTASPISDLNPLFLAANCILTVVSKDGERKIKMDAGFFTGYRKTIVKPDEILLSIHVPYTDANEYFYGYKQSRRREDDIAIVNAGMKVRFRPNSDVIEVLRIAYGGMAPITVMAAKTMTSLIGKKWDDSIVESASKLIAEDLPLDPHAPGGMIEFRRTLTTSFFFKFYLQVLQRLKSTNLSQLSPVGDTKIQSAIAPYKKNQPKSSQLFQMVAPGQRSNDPVGRPEVHKSALEQASGEAIYCDDIMSYPNELQMGIVQSTRAHAKILSIDASEALAVDGIEAFISHKDLSPEKNIFMPNEVLFVTDEVTYNGQMIGVLLGIDKNTVRKATQLIRVEYEDIKPVIITLEDAIASDCIMKNHSLSISSGDVEQGFSESEHILEGEVRMGGQEHFYMEPQSNLAIPLGEHMELQIFSSTQWPSSIQHTVAAVLGEPANRVVVKTKRIGGGFGGKESRTCALATACALAAKILNRPVRFILDRDEDMSMTGTRHPFLSKYKVGFLSSGKINALDVVLHANAGFSLDASQAVMGRAVHHVQNCYRIPHMKVTGHIYRSNIASCTAFRGFGGPQGMLVAETFVEHIATTLGLEPEKIRKLNLYRENDVTHYHQSIPSDAIFRCWEDCEIQSDFFRRQQQVLQFNKENRWRKRGISMLPTMYGISFGVKFMIQGGSLIHIYQDGSVLLTHGGVEMGQGLNTKMIQVASRVLGIPSDKIHISEMSTDKVPNASVTAGSMSSDIYGMAVMSACQTIKERLEPVINQNPKGSWEQWIKAAYMQRISLSTTGFYKSDARDYDWKTNTGEAYDYFTNGVSCTEVEIDCLTGHHQVLRTDIVMDVGQSMNPAIDIGQIEGGFMQGYGLFTMEELRHSPDGFLLTRGPGTYKLPSISDIPTEFNVFLLKGSTSPRAIYSSKAIGEPPVFLAASTFFALKEAIRDARKEEGIDGHFTLVSPATCERIRMACTDKFTNQFPPADSSTFTPWSLMA